MDGTTVLVIEDEPKIRRVVRTALGAGGASVIEAADGREGIDLAAAMQPALIVLDLGLPDIAGVSVCLEIRKWSSAPIIVLSAQHSDRHKVELLDAGADDYVTKPFSTTEFQARVRAQLRRATLGPTADAEPVEIGRLRIDLARRTVTREGSDIHLTPTEWDLLRSLVKHAGRTLTHQQIFREVWRSPAGNAQEYLWVHVSNLRRKIERNPMRPELIITEPGVGYRFRALD
jgi:two-component system, OmpR family, KDP operon response regulator KdpE